MGVFSFAKDIGDKLFHRNKKQDAAQPTAAPAATPAEEPTAQEIANLLLARIQAQNVNINGLKVNYNGDTDTVTLSGVAKTQADRERARLRWVMSSMLRRWLTILRWNLLNLNHDFIPLNQVIAYQKLPRKCTAMRMII